jgi:uncharacterized protein YdbL (DUF1318 family)
MGFTARRLAAKTPGKVGPDLAGYIAILRVRAGFRQGEY